MIILLCNFNWNCILFLHWWASRAKFDRYTFKDRPWFI